MRDHYTMHVYAMYILLCYERDYPKDVIEIREDDSEEMIFKLRAKGWTGYSYLQSRGEEKASRGNSMYKVTNTRNSLEWGTHLVPHITSAQPSVSAIAVVDGPCELKLTCS